MAEAQNAIEQEFAAALENMDERLNNLCNVTETLSSDLSQIKEQCLQNSNETLAQANHFTDKKITDYAERTTVEKLKRELDAVNSYNNTALPAAIAGAAVLFCVLILAIVTMIRGSRNKKLLEDASSALTHAKDEIKQLKEQQERSRAEYIKSNEALRKEIDALRGMDIGLKVKKPSIDECIVLCNQEYSAGRLPAHALLKKYNTLVYAATLNPNGEIALGRMSETGRHAFVALELDAWYLLPNIRFDDGMIPLGCLFDGTFPEAQISSVSVAARLTTPIKGAGLTAQMEARGQLSCFHTDLTGEALQMLAVIDGYAWNGKAAPWQSGLTHLKEMYASVSKMGLMVVDGHDYLTIYRTGPVTAAIACIADGQKTAYVYPNKADANDPLLRLLFSTKDQYGGSKIRRILRPVIMTKAMVDGSECWRVARLGEIIV